MRANSPKQRCPSPRYVCKVLLTSFGFLLSVFKSACSLAIRFESLAIPPLAEGVVVLQLPNTCSN